MAVSKKDYIDAVRGWAIIFVITCHVGGMFAEMPHPIKKLTNFGWHGVQLFFLASAVTLLMSWHRQAKVDGATLRHFFLRRFLRIAPMYYIGAIIYFYFLPPASGLDLAQALRALTFVNAWHPDWLPTTGNWMVVPGGWSIGVEFTFYLVFPALALLCTTLARSIVFLVLSIALAVLMEPIGQSVFQDYGDAATSTFLYFWFFNQFPIFALGFVLYFLILRPDMQISGRVPAYVLLAVTALSCLVLSQHGLGERFRPAFMVPTLFAVSLLFMVFVFVLARGPKTILTHPVIQRMGAISFSSYILHFLFVHNLPAWTGGLVDVRATGYAAIANGAVLWLLTMICTVATASVAFRVIEQPAISLAHRLTASRRTRMPGTPALRDAGQA